METKLLKEINLALSSFPQYWENDILLKTKVIEDLRTYDKALIGSLLSSETIKDAYLISIDGNNIFKIDDFITMLRYKTYWENSYTKYTSEIGLSLEGRYMKYSTDVTLDFPHKDCILEGGMNKEDIEKKEIYYHETLAKEEIDVLFSPKVLSNVKKYNKDGMQEVTEVTDEDNLIIKGNNLISLHTLKKRYTKKVKCVYIDPPYNTSSAASTFSYNNNFNHSSWLTFMKNRVEVAKELLTDDGIFIVAIDHNELFYLGVLLDEIFGRDNRLGIISVVHNPGGRQDEMFFPTAHENMIVYAKDRSKAVINNLPSTEDKLKQYKLEDKYGKYKLRGYRRSGNNSRKIDRPKLFYPIYVDIQNNILSTTPFSNSIEIVPLDENGIERCWRWGKETFELKKEKYIEIKKTKNGIDLYTKERESDYLGEKPKTIWNKPQYTGQSATNDLKKIFDDKVFSYPKSMYLMIDVLTVATGPNDIILDFFGGSGTTANAVLELNKKDGGNRKFILCEQMDYVENVTVERIKRVLTNDLNAESNDSFIFSELFPLNQKYATQVLSVNTKQELESVLKDITEGAFLNFKVDMEKVTFKNDAFASLSLEEQKKVILKTLDMNQLYLSYSEIDDIQYDIPEATKQFNRSFYKQSNLKNEVGKYE